MKPFPKPSNSNLADEIKRGDVSRVVDAGRASRRVITPGGVDGIFTVSLVNQHFGGSTVVNVLDPYNVEAAAVGEFPGRVPDGFDLWLIGASMYDANALGAAVTGILMMGGTPIGAAKKEDGSFPGSSKLGPTALATWKTVIVRGQWYFGELDGGGTFANLGIRLPRGSNVQGANLRFYSTSTASAEYWCTMTLGLVPSIVEQDFIS